MVGVLASATLLTGATTAEEEEVPIIVPRERLPGLYSDEHGTYDDFIVAFEQVPPEIVVGSEYEGGLVRTVEPEMGFIVVSPPDEQFASRAAADPRVTYVEPDYYRYIAATPNDPWYSSQANVKQIRLNDAWNFGYGSTTARVCVLDTGVRYTHEDITGSRWLGGYDYVNTDADPVDDEGHGTHVTGIAAAGANNGKGIAGAGNFGIHHVKVANLFGAVTSSRSAQGINWCANNAITRTVISMSYASGAYSSTEANAVNYAYNTKGQLLVASVGNDMSTTVTYPAKHANVMGVGCTTSSRTLCSFSNVGPEVEIAAPGINVWSTCFTSNTAICQESGTSQSAPLVSGTAALFWTYNSGLTNAQVRQWIRDTARDLDKPYLDNKFGYGEIDAKCLLDKTKGCVGPTNNNRANAHDLGVSAPVSFYQHNWAATLESGETASCASIGATVWYKFTPLSSGLRTFTTASASTTFNTVLAVYVPSPTGSGLVSVACNDDASASTTTSQISLPVVPGQTYYIQVGGKSGATGMISFSIW